MLRTLWFQLHWFLGIIAALVLIILGITGGMLSFEKELIRALNTDILRVHPTASEPLLPAQLLEQARHSLPERQINALTLAADPKEAAIINVAGEGAQARRGVNHYFNPYTGEWLSEGLKGQAFFQTVQHLHRWLLMGDVGKQITAAATVMLIVLVLSGVYLRWPRSWQALRRWLHFNWRRRGRGRVAGLHSVVGTWLVPLYLLACFTGLYWSYDWYRAGLHQLSAVPMQQRPAPPRDGAVQMPLADETLNRAWQQFAHSIPHGYASATLRLSPANGQLHFIYFDPKAPHERAWNRLTLDVDQLTVVQHRRYADLPLNEKLMASMLPLHSGSFFGLPGRILMMLASLLIPLFVITGLMLYIDRRRRTLRS